MTNDKLDQYVPLKITSDMKLKLEKIQKDEFRGNLSETIRALLMWAIKEKD